MEVEQTVILGMNFSGSTVLSGLLQNIPDVICPGETIYFLYGRSTQCTECNGPCKVLDRFAERVRTTSCYNPKRLFGDILASTKKKHLISSDKGLEETLQLIQLAPWGQTNFIVLFKDPRDLAWSWNSRFANGYRLNELPWKFDAFYRRVEKTDGGAKRAYLFYEDMIKNPEWAVRAIADELGLQQPSEVKFPPDNWHNIRGNQAFRRPKWENKLQLLHEWRQLPEDALEHAERSEMFAVLMEKRLLPPTE